jgi:hypothetical protein
MDEICNAPNLSDDIGLVAYDSATSMGQALLQAAAYSTFQIGQRPNSKFTVAKGDKTLQVGSNTDAHYGVIQSFMLKKIWESMQLIRSEKDVLWTFTTQRGEEQDSSQVLGGKLVGKALTPVLPTWYTYFWRIESMPQSGLTPLHRLYLTEYPDSAGMGHSFGNSRAPLGQVLPPYLEPASIPEAFRLLRDAESQAELDLKAELGL